MMITYRELLKKLEGFSEEQLDQTVTVYITEQNEYYGLGIIPIRESDAENDVLDINHKYLVI